MKKESGHNNDRKIKSVRSENSKDNIEMKIHDEKDHDAKSYKLNISRNELKENKNIESSERENNNEKNHNKNIEVSQKENNNEINENRNIESSQRENNIIELSQRENNNEINQNNKIELSQRENNNELNQNNKIELSQREINNIEISQGENNNEINENSKIELSLREINNIELSQRENNNEFKEIPQEINNEEIKIINTAHVNKESFDKTNSNDEKRIFDSFQKISENLDKTTNLQCSKNINEKALSKLENNEQNTNTNFILEEIKNIDSENFTRGTISNENNKNSLKSTKDLVVNAEQNMWNFQSPDNIIKAKNKNDPKKFNRIQDEFLLQNHSYFEKIEKSFDSSRNTGNNNNDSKLKIKIEISIKYSSRANKLNPRIQTPQNCKKI